MHVGLLAHPRVLSCSRPRSRADTSILATGPSSAAITYNKFWYKDFGPNKTVKAWPGPAANFAIQVKFP